MTDGEPMHSAFKRFGEKMSGVRLGFGPMAKLQDRYYRYLAHCETLGLTRGDAAAILTGVDHVVRQIPQPMDALDEATDAASRFAAHRAREARASDGS